MNLKLRSILISLIIVLGQSFVVQAVVYQVTTNDSDASVANSLPWCVAQSNASTTVDDTILFTLSTSNTITVHAPLIITDRVDVQGNSHTVGAHDGTGSNPVDCFQFTADSSGSTITGLAIISSNTAVDFSSNANRIYLCRIGLTWSNNTDGNIIGIRDQGSFNTIGRSGVLYANIIADNTSAGIFLEGSFRSTVQSNFIGVDYLSFNAIGTQAVGINVNAHQALIGGNSPSGEYNYIGGHSQYGINIISTQQSGNTIAGNTIGLNFGGTAALPNATGIRIIGSSGNIIGLPMSGYGNVIAGSTNRNIHMVNTDSNRLQNNYIGTNQSGTFSSSTLTGIYMQNSDANIIGGKLAIGSYERNVISGHTSQTGIELDSTSNGNVITGNFIGTTPDGLSALPNSVGINMAGMNNTIGDTSTEGGDWYGNLISGNSSDAIVIRGNSNTVRATIIGLNINRASSATIPNGQHGIVVNSAENNTIGGNNNGSSVQGNWISANATWGVYLNNAHNTMLTGNSIGWNSNRSTTIGNVGSGVVLWSSNNCTVGGDTVNSRNYIAGLDATSMIVQFSSRETVIRNNYFDTNGTSQATGTGSASVQISGAPYTLIDQNHFARQVQLAGSECFGTTLTANVIGQLPDGSAVTGINIAISCNYAHGNMIGLQTGNNGNLITNCVRGIYMTGVDTKQNAIYSNTITACTTFPIHFESNANEDKAAPVISNAVSSSHVSGTTDANDVIQVFIAEGSGNQHGSLRVIGSTIADGSGNWSAATASLAAGEYVCAIATDSNNNSSQMSNKIQAVVPTVTPTPTLTATITLTATPSPTSTITATNTTTPTISPTATVSPTVTGTPTVTITPTMTVTTQLGDYALNGKVALVYPSPAKDKVHFLLHIDGQKDVEINLYNLAGEKSEGLKATLSGKGQVMTWDCSKVAPGIYIAAVKEDGELKGLVKIAITK